MREGRTVHAVLSDGEMVVRYDRPGKWKIEYPNERALPAVGVTVSVAARLVRDDLEAQHTPGLSGGGIFDRLVARG